MENESVTGPVDGEPPAEVVLQKKPRPAEIPFASAVRPIPRADYDAASSHASSTMLQLPSDAEWADAADAQTVAESKQVTTANVDRWKRTFQAMRMAVRLAIRAQGVVEDDDEELYQRTLRSQATSVADEETMEHDIFDEITRRETTRSYGVISPDSVFKSIWDFMGLIFIIVEALIIPFKLGFSVDLPFAWDMFEVAMDFYFIVDMVLCFNTGFYSEGVMIMGRKPIIYNYLVSWFLLDVAATFPYGWVVEGCIGDGCSGSTENISLSYKAPQLLRLLKLFRFLRLIRVLKMQRLLIKIEESLMSDLLNTVIKFGKLFSNVIFLAHWMACLFYLVGQTESTNYHNSWIVMAEIIDLPLYDRYVTTLYWAITTMLTVGYGDIHPYTSSEKICVMACMFVSCIMFAYVVGSIGDIVSKSNNYSAKLRQQMVGIAGFLQQRRTPKEIQLKVKRYFEYVMGEKTKLAMDEKEMMELLSVPLRDELLIYFHGSMIQKCPIFDDFSIDFLSYLTFFLRTEQFSVGDTIFEEKDYGNKMYFVVRGHVLLYLRSPLAVLSELKEDNYFGEIGFFGHKPRTASADSVAFTEVLAISHSGLSKAFDNFPQAKVRLTEIQEEIGLGLLESLKIMCYFCNEPGHIAANCPEGYKRLPEKNEHFSCAFKVLRRKIRNKKILDLSQQSGSHRAKLAFKSTTNILCRGAGPAPSVLASTSAEFVAKKPELHRATSSGIVSEKKLGPVGVKEEPNSARQEKNNVEFAKGFAENKPEEEKQEHVVPLPAVQRKRTAGGGGFSPKSKPELKAVSQSPTVNRFRPNMAMRINQSLSPTNSNAGKPRVAFVDMKKENEFPGPSPTWSRRITRQKASGQWNTRIALRKQDTSHPSSMLEQKDVVNFTDLCRQETERQFCHENI